MNKCHLIIEMKSIGIIIEKFSIIVKNLYYKNIYNGQVRVVSSNERIFDQIKKCVIKFSSNNYVTKPLTKKPYNFKCLSNNLSHNSLLVISNRLLV